MTSFIAIACLYKYKMTFYHVGRYLQMKLFLGDHESEMNIMEKSPIYFYKETAIWIKTGFHFFRKE